MAKANQVATPDRRVAQVAKIIGSDKARIDEIERAIQFVDWDQQALQWPPRPNTKRDHLIARRYGQAIARLEKQLKRGDDAKVLERVIYRYGEEFDAWVAQFKEWRECFEVFGGKPLSRKGGLFKGLNLPDVAWRLGRPRPSAWKFRRKHQAVEAAASLLESHGLRLTATRKSPSTKASVFCRVAAALLGDPRADLYHQCRAFLKTRNRVPK